jgi:hypothetical protein
MLEKVMVGQILEKLVKVFLVLILKILVFDLNEK